MYSLGVRKEGSDNQEFRDLAALSIKERYSQHVQRIYRDLTTAVDAVTARVIAIWELDIGQEPVPFRLSRWRLFLPTNADGPTSNSFMYVPFFVAFLF